MVAILADGDITKRDFILWNVTMTEVSFFLDIQMDKFKFRKCVLGYFGIKDKQDDPTDEEYLESIAHFKARKK